MSADAVAAALVFSAVLPATAFPIIYAFTPWWRSFLGRALMTKAVGIALLIDIHAAYALFGDDYPGRNIVRITVFSLVIVGIWLQCTALVLTMTRRRPRVDSE